MDFGIRDQAIGDFGKVLDLLLLHIGHTTTEHNVLSKAIQKRLEHTRGGLDLHELVFVRCGSFTSQLQDGVEVFVVFLLQLLGSKLSTRSSYLARLPSWETPL